MVFESIVVEVLNRFLGDYVVNLDGSQLKIGIWGGDVVLNNLELKENALSELGLPIKTIAGRLGKLTLKIPWKNLYTQPVIVNIEGLNLLAVPTSGVKYDADKEEKAKREAKKKELDRIEAIKIQEAEKGKTKGEPDSFTEKLVAQVIKNLQMKIDRIHIRYEDTVTNVLHPYALGITLHNLTFQTTDQDYNLGSGQDTGKFIYKLVALDSFSVYWNSGSTLYSKESPSQRDAYFEKDIASSTNPPPSQIKYVLGPINSTARLCLNQKPENDGSGYTIPKINLTLDMESIALSLSKSQYQDIMELLQSLERISLANLYREYRPDVPIASNVKIWWHFAYNCIVENGVRRRKRNWSWDHIFSHRNRIREYKETYRQTLSNKKIAVDVKFKLEELEYLLDVFTITLARKQAEVEYARLGQTKSNEGYTGWISSWFTGKKEKKDGDTGIVKQFEEAMSLEEKSKLYTAIGYQENAAPAVYPTTFVENSFSFLLHNLKLVVKDDHLSQPDVINMSLSEVFCHVKMRPSAQAIEVAVGVGALTTHGHQNGGLVPVIAKSLVEADGKSELLLDLKFETNPLDQRVPCDQRLIMKARPMQIVYHAETVNHLSDVFTAREAVSLTGLQEAALSTLQDFKEMSATGLQHAIDVHKTIHVQIDVKASHIIVPENGVYTNESRIIVANLGSLEIKNMEKKVQRAIQSTNEADKLKEMMDQSYDRFSIKLTGVNVMLAGPGYNVTNQAVNKQAAQHLLKPTDLYLGLYKCFVMDDPRLPRLKVDGELPSFELVVSDENLLELAAIVFSIPTNPIEALELPQVRDQQKSDGAEFPSKNSRAIKQLTKSEFATRQQDGTASVGQTDAPALQSTALEVSFKIGKLGVTIVRKNAPLMTFEIINFGVLMKQHPFDMSVDVFIGGVTMEHKLFTTLSGGPLYILRTPMTEGSQENLLTVFYLNANKKGPEFHTSYKSILQLIQIRFSKLSVALHQEAILDTMKFFDDLMTDVTKTQDRLKPPVSGLARKDFGRSTSSIVESVLEFGKDGVAKRVRMKRKRTDELVVMQIDAVLDSFSVSIFNSQKPITDLYVKGLDSGVTIQKSKTSISARLKNIVVHDPDSTAIYKQILSFVDGNALEAKIINFNDATSGNDQWNMTAFDTSLDVNIGCVRLIFLNKFVVQVMDFVNQFQLAKEKVMEAGVQAAEAARQNMQNIYKNATRMKIVFRMKAPLIVVPQNSSSSNVLVADLGFLSVENRLSLDQQLRAGDQPPLFDTFNIKLEKLQLSRALFDAPTSTTVAECLLLEPITFVLRLTRNLSIGWYKEAPEINVSGKLEAVCLVMTQEDYSGTMAVLNENLAEGNSQPSIKSSSSEQEHSQTGVSVPSAEVVVEDLPPLEQVYQRVTFAFQLTSLTIKLYNGSSHLGSNQDDMSKELRLSQPLAWLELQTLALKGNMLSDGKISTTLILVDCLLDDTRLSRTGGIKRFMERTAGNKNDMIDVTFLQEASGNKFLDVKIFNFTLVLCVDFLLSLGQFFSGPSKGPEKAIVASGSSTSSTKKKEVAKPAERPTSSMKINFKLERPDIILVEDINDIDSPGIILNNELGLTLRSTPDTMHISTSLTNLQLKTCCVNPEKRASTLSEVLSPCTISVTCIQPFGEGMRADVNTTDIVLHVTPSTIQLLSKISSAASAKPDDCKEAVDVVCVDYSDIWNEKDLTDDIFWFLKTEVAEEAIDFECSHEATESAVASLNEIAVVEIKSIIVTIEMGVGNKTIPLVLLESSMSAKIKDWSKQLRFESCFTLETGVYNERLAVWEPLIEPVQGTNECRPWELTIEFKKNDEEDDAACVDEEDIDEIKFLPPKAAMNITSNDTLELTVTKTSIGAIQNLIEAFNDAVSSNLPASKDLPSSPYSVKNETGLVVTLLLENQDFEVLNDQTSSIKEVRLEGDSPVSLNLNAKAQTLTNRSVLREQDSHLEQRLMIKVNDIDSVVRQLSVTKMDKRYFPLPKRTYPGDQWGMVTEVSSSYGYKTITLRSNVQISNHMSVPVEAYYMTEGGNEVKFCGTAEPNSILNLPLHAVYTVTNEIFFCPKFNGYTVSIVPFVWKDLLKIPTMSKTLQCDPRDNNGLPFFMNAIGEIEQVYYEDTQKKTMTSTCFVIRLFPTVVLCNFLPIPITYNLKGSNAEVTLNEGYSKELLTVQLNSSTITITIPNYLGEDWVSTVKLTSEMPVICTFETVGIPKQILDLGIHSQSNGDYLNLTLYCPFWMINKTGLQLSYMRSRKSDKGSSSHLGSPAKSDDPGNFIIHPPSIDSPILFSFRPKLFFSKKKASIKVENSEWSDKFSLDTVGSSGNVLCKSKIGHNYEVGLQIHLTSSGLSKIVVFTPFYLLVNNCSFSVDYRESLASSQDWVHVPAGECQSFWPKYATNKKELILKVSDTSEESKPFTFHNVHTTFLQLNNSKGGLNTNCKITESSIVLTIDEYADGVASVRLVNHGTESTLDFWQHGSNSRYSLESGKYLLYTWDDPIGAGGGTRQLIWCFAGQKEMKDGLMMDGIGEYVVNTEKTLYWVSFLDGMQRVLMFTDDLAIATNAQCAGELEVVEMDIGISLQAIGLSLVDDILRREVTYIALASSGVIWEQRKEGSKRYQPYNLKDCNIIEIAFQKYLNELSMGKKPKKRQVLDGRIDIDFEENKQFRPNVRKIRRSFLPGLWFQYQISPHRQQYHARINKLQIDNQLDDCIFPTVFAPVPIPKSVASDTAPKPFVEASIILRTSEHSSVKQYKYFKVLIQEFHIKLDLGFINSLIELGSAAEPTPEKKVEKFQADLNSLKIDLGALAEITSSQAVKNFYDVLHFSPLKVHVSFSMQGGNSDDPKQPSQIHSNLLNLLLQSVGFTLTDIQDVVFKLAYFEKEHLFMTQGQLTSECISHYTSQAIKQMYVLVLGLDVIGNPFGLVTQLGKGVEDFFYEPFQGAIQGPEEFAEGLALGVKSLLGSAVGGAAGAVSRITGTLGKGIATLTLDDDYQRKRREALNRRPANLQEGLARSGKGLVMGVYDGVTGVFVKPIEGAKEEGVEGFFKGVGKGMVGLVTRPTSGVIDFASGSLDAVKRVTDMSEEVNRMRPPRYFQADGVVRSYNKYEAEGNRLLKMLEKGKFSETDIYVAHVAVTQDEKCIFIVTDKRLIMISKGDIFGQWNCEWQITYPEIKEPIVSPKGLEITFREKKKKVMGLFGSSNSGKIVEIKSPDTQQWILKKILTVLKIS